VSRHLLEVFTYHDSCPDRVSARCKKRNRERIVDFFLKPHFFRLLITLTNIAELSETLRERPAAAGIFSLDNYPKDWNVMYLR
jgi:hypothetical protein